MSRAICAALLGSAMLVVAAPAANASLNWDRASFDFGSRSVGTTSDPQTFALIANCDAPLIPGVCGSPAGFTTVAGLPTTTGTGFAIVPATDVCTARGGVLITPTFPGTDVCTLQVIFKPTSGGTKTGKLQVPAGPSIALSGIGVGTGNGTTTAKKCKKKKRSASAAKKCKKKK